MQRLTTLCTRLGLALLTLAVGIGIYSLAASAPEAWTVAIYFLVPGLIAVFAGRLLAFAQSLEELVGVSDRTRRLAAYGLLVAATLVLVHIAARVVELQSGYQGVVVRKSVDPSWFWPGLRGWVEYAIVVRDPRGGESTHFITSTEGLHIQVGDTVVKERGFFHGPYRLGERQ